MDRAFGGLLARFGRWETAVRFSCSRRHFAETPSVALAGVSPLRCKGCKNSSFQPKTPLAQDPAVGQSTNETFPRTGTPENRNATEEVPSRKIFKLCVTVSQLQRFNCPLHLSDSRSKSPESQDCESQDCESQDPCAGSALWVTSGTIGRRNRRLKFVAGPSRLRGDRWLGSEGIAGSAQRG